MFTALTIGTAYIIAKKLDDAGNYRTPTGKDKKRYKE